MTCEEIINRIKDQHNPANVAGMARYGIEVTNAYGVPMPVLRAMGKEIGRDHALALELWATGIHEARILASLVADPKLATEAQMEQWAADFNSWDICDQVCGNLFERTQFAYSKAVEWSKREETFIRRAGFVLMARVAVSDKKAPDEPFEEFLQIIEAGSDDDRNFVKKAVNWALRQIGKRNLRLNGLAIAAAERIRQINSKSARWIASDALRELTSEAVQVRLMAKTEKNR